MQDEFNKYLLGPFHGPGTGTSMVDRDERGDKFP